MTHEPFELMHISELLRQREPTVQWIVAGIVPKGGITFIVAKSGTGKSLLAYDLTACIITGEPWLGTIPVMQGGVAYIDLDGEPATAGMRALAALKSRGFDMASVERLPLFVSAAYSLYDVREEVRRDAMITTLAAVPDLRLVIFDTYGDLHRGEESSSGGASQASPK